MTHQSKNRRPKSKIARRRGMIIMIVLVTLVAAAMAAVAILRSAASEHRQVRAARERLQAEQLASAGFDRAAAQLRASTAYSGETWRVPAEELGGNKAAVVAIRVETIAGEPNQRRFVVVAQYPDDPVRRNQISREMEITIK